MNQGLAASRRAWAPRYDAAPHIVAEMRTHVLVAGAALILAGLTAGCERTTPGTVAMTTQPGPPINSPTNTDDGARAAGHPHT